MCQLRNSDGTWLWELNSKTFQDGSELQGQFALKPETFSEMKNMTDVRGATQNIKLP